MNQVAKNLYLAAVLAAVCIFACTDTSPPTPPNHEVNAPFTVRRVGMKTVAFVKLADDLILSKAPRWYNPDTKIHLNFDTNKNFATTIVTINGTLNIVLERHALVLATVEDMAAVLLHEYVHVESWDYVYTVGELASFETEEYKEGCLNALAEMLANKVVVEMYYVIGYGRVMLQHQTFLYQENYVYAKEHKCPTVITFGMPKVVRPVTPDAE